MATLSAFLLRVILIAACGSLAVAAVLFSVAYPLMACLMAVGIAYRRSRGGGRGGLWSMGSARTSNLLDVARQGLLSDKGLILGRCNFLEPPTRRQAFLGLLSPHVATSIATHQFAASFGLSRGGSDQMIRVRDFVHLATFSPTGGGKGVSSVIPNMLSFGGSMVIVDPKGEIYRLTAEHRRTQFGHQIVRLDPDGVCGPGGDGLNPLDFLDVHSASFADQCRDLADMLIYRTGTEPDPHWTESAVLFLCAFIAYVRGQEPNPSDRNLSIIYELITSQYCFGRAVAEMQTVKACDGVIARLGETLGCFKDRELASVLTTLNRNLAFVNSPAVQACVNRSSFHPRDLRNGKTTVYLILPPDRLTTAAPLMRMWIGTLLREIARMGASERHPILFMLDEFAHLGRMQALEDAFTLMRGYGVRLWIFLQSIEQLHDIYSTKAPVILGNIATQQYFGINAYESASAISKRVGDYTILVRSLNGGKSWSDPVGGHQGNGKPPGSFGRNDGYTVNETGRPLFRPEEVLTLRPDVALVFHKNMHVIPAKLLAYYSAPEFANGGIGRSRSPGMVKSLVILAVLLVGGWLAVEHGLPVATAALGRLTGQPSAGSGFPSGSYVPFFTPRYRPKPVRRQALPPMWWVWPNGDWVVFY